jgi:hypothetical protein
VQNEPQNSGADSREEPKINSLEDHLNVINVIQQSAVIITGREVKGGHPESDESDPNAGCRPLVAFRGPFEEWIQLLE